MAARLLYQAIRFPTITKFWMSDVQMEKIDQAITSGHGRNDPGATVKPKEQKGSPPLTSNKPLGGMKYIKSSTATNKPRPSDPYCDKIVLQTRSILQVLQPCSADFIAVPPGSTFPK